MNAALLTLALLCGPQAGADSAASRPALTLPQQLAIVKNLEPSRVIVEYTLRYDKGQPPEGGAVLSAGGEQLIREKRPLQLVGWLVAAGVVAAPDIGVHERFVERVAVRFADTVLPAQVTAFGRDAGVTLCEVERPPASARPLVFGAADTAACLVLTCERPTGVWTMALEGVAATVRMEQGGRVTRPAPAGGLIVNRKGEPLGFAMEGELPVDGSWRGSPQAWPLLRSRERDEALEHLSRRCDEALLAVELQMRSPRTSGGASLDQWRGAESRGDNVTATQAHAVGVLLPGGSVLVLADLPAEATARLDRAAVYDDDGKPHPARFAGTLAEYGGLLLQPDKPLRHGLRLAAGSVEQYRGRLLLKARISMAGNERNAHYWHGRVEACGPGYRGVLYPRGEGGEEGLFLFTLEGELLALPLPPRRSAAARHENQYEASSPTAGPMPVAALAPLLADPRPHLDTSNVPRSEEQEGRIAWMGVVLQALDRELARANGVAEQTGDGESGALVSYVYPGSPADAAGIKPGMVLLRIEAPGQPQPINVRVEHDVWDEPFPWDQLDEVPEEYFDRIPTPWPAEENGFNRMLTELGFGTSFRADFMDHGRQFSARFTVVESPPHYGSAKRWKSEGLGLTVRDLTYEARRHFQKTAKDPGVIVSKIEPGSRAAVAGVRPYELIIQVDGQPVTSASQFGSLAAKARELRLSVERMGRMRQVRIKM